MTGGGFGGSKIATLGSHTEHAPATGRAVTSHIGHGAGRPAVMTLTGKYPDLLTEIPHPRGSAETGGTPLRLAVFDHRPAQGSPLRSCSHGRLGSAWPPVSGDSSAARWNRSWPGRTPRRLRRTTSVPSSRSAVSGQYGQVGPTTTEPGSAGVLSW